MSDQKPQTHLPNLNKNVSNPTPKKTPLKDAFINGNVNKNLNTKQKEKLRKVKTEAMEISEIINGQENNISKNKSQI